MAALVGLLALPLQRTLCVCKRCELSTTRGASRHSMASQPMPVRPRGDPWASIVAGEPSKVERKRGRRGHMRHLRRSWSILRDLCFQTLFALLIRRQRRPKKKRVRSLRDRIAAEVEQQGDEAFDKEQEAHAEDEIADSGVRVTLQSVDAEADNRKTEYDEGGNTFVGASADPEDEAHDQTGEG